MRQRAAPLFRHPPRLRSPSLHAAARRALDHTFASCALRDPAGRGTCVRGYCSCEPGWFGLDCSVELAKISHFPDRTTFPLPEAVPYEFGTNGELMPPHAHSDEYTEVSVVGLYPGARAEGW